MAINEQESEQTPIRLSVELSPALYEAILKILETSQAKVSVNELLDVLETRLEGVVASTVSDATGVDTPFPQGVEVEITADDEDDPVEGFRQAWRDAMTGNTHPASVLWDDKFWDTPDDE